MIKESWQFFRERIVSLALRHPPLVALLMFLFLLTVSNQVYSATRLAIDVPSFWHMLLMGTVMATFGAMLLYEVLRVYRRLTEVQFVRAVVSTLHHEINNPLMVIQLSAEKLRNVKAYDDAAVANILEHGRRIREVMARLDELEEQVHLRRDISFTRVIDLERSR